jgi:hypothetical protein
MNLEDIRCKAVDCIQLYHTGSGIGLFKVLCDECILEMFDVEIILPLYVQS